MNNLLDAVIAAKLAGGGSGGGGEVTPESIVTATGQMTAEQKAATTQNIGAVSSAEFTPTEILLSVDGDAVELDLNGIGLTVQQFLEAYAAGKRFIFAIAEDNSAVLLTLTYSDDGSTIVLTGYDNRSLYVAELSAEGEYVMSGTLRIIQLSSMESLKLTATPTAGPSGNTLMSGTWSGATWEEVMAAVQASRLIQIDVTGVGPVTLLYNAGSATEVASTNFTYPVDDAPRVCGVSLHADNSFETYVITNPYERTDNFGASTTISITPDANTIYQCGELTSLTISNPPATGAYSIVFTSGSTATTTTIPSTILGLESFAAEANTLYEINVLDNRAVVGSWAVSA